jgi:hypothetical protein
VKQFARCLQQDSLLEPSEGLGLDLFPGDNIVGVGCVVGQAALQPLRLGEQRRVRFGGDAVPKAEGQ